MDRIFLNRIFLSTEPRKISIKFWQILGRVFRFALRNYISLVTKVF